jgi:hypothetical protein
MDEVSIRSRSAARQCALLCILGILLLVAIFGGDRLQHRYAFHYWEQQSRVAETGGFIHSQE